MTDHRDDTGNWQLTDADDYEDGECEDSRQVDPDLAHCQAEPAYLRRLTLSI